jgi:hypothetical protein
VSFCYERGVAVEVCSQLYTLNAISFAFLFQGFPGINIPFMAVSSLAVRQYFGAFYISEHLVVNPMEHDLPHLERAFVMFVGLPT